MRILPLLFLLFLPQSIWAAETPLNPLILADLSRWLSDQGDQVISIDLKGAALSNRYYCNIQTNEEGWASCAALARQDARSGFAYRLLPLKHAELILAETRVTSMGSGFFHNLLLLRRHHIPATKVLNNDIEIGAEVREVLTKLLELPLGDRFNGKISIENNRITLSPATGESQFRYQGHPRKDPVVLTLQRSS